MPGATALAKLVNLGQWKEPTVTIETAESTADQWTQRLIPLLTGGAALLLTVVAGAGLWMRIGHGDVTTEPVGSEAPATTAPLSEETAPQIGGMAELYRQQAAASSINIDRPDHLPAVYVAHSAAQAEAQRSLIAATNADRTRSGLPPLWTTVVVADSPSERERAARILAELNVMSGSLEIHLVELPDETAAPSGAFTGSSVSDARDAMPQFTVFVVESEIAAGRLPEQLERNLPAGGALPRNPSAEHVLIVGSPEAAATAWVTVEGLRATHGRDRVQVMDLRPQPTAQQFPVGGGTPPLSDQSAGMP
jgi:hypothetical protein